MNTATENSFFDKKGKPNMNIIANHLNDFAFKYYRNERGTVWIQYILDPNNDQVCVTIFSGNQNTNLNIYAFYNREKVVAVVQKLEWYFADERPYSILQEDEACPELEA